MYDILIKNGWIVDGTGKKKFQGDLAIKEDRIAKISDKIDEQAKMVIYADGKIVSPGFIDVHTHDDLVFDLDPWNEAKLRQGVTTVITGNCGFGAAPATEMCREDLIAYNAPILGEQVETLLFDSFEEYLNHMEGLKKAMNVACLVPHGAIYASANGFSSQTPGDEALEKERTYVIEAMEAGALGVSLGLMYAPGCYSKSEELEMLAAETGKRGGILTIHMKSESEHFEDSIAEAAELSKKCHVPIEISHLKHVGKAYWGHMSETLNWLEELLSAGADLSFDMYPYTMGSTTMSILFPTEYLQDGVGKLLERLSDRKVRCDIAKRLKESWGEEDNLSLLSGWENVIISSVKNEKNTGVLGKSIAWLAMEKKKEVEEVFFDLFVEEEGEVSVLLNHINREDMEKTLMFPQVSVASDGLPGAKDPHPRLYGTFPHFLKEFVKEKALLTWEEAIRKITSQPAYRFGLRRRGVLQEGYFADITIFDPEHIKDLADYQNPQRYPEGIEYIFVNGQAAWTKGGLGEAGQGRLLKNFKCEGGSI